jgi:hypothetical protein
MGELARLEIVTPKDRAGLQQFCIAFAYRPTFNRRPIPHDKPHHVVDILLFDKLDREAVREMPNDTSHNRSDGYWHSKRWFKFCQNRNSG